MAAQRSDMMRAELKRIKLKEAQDLHLQLLAEADERRRDDMLELKGNYEARRQQRET